MNFKAVLVEKTSKAGKPYTCIEVYITEKTKKMVFLSDSDLELIEMIKKNQQPNK